MGECFDEDYCRCKEPVFTWTVTRDNIAGWLMSHNLPDSDANIETTVARMHDCPGLQDAIYDGIRTALDNWIDRTELEHFKPRTVEDTAYTDSSTDFLTPESGRGAAR